MNDKKTMINAIDPGVNGAIATLVDGKLVGVSDFSPLLLWSLLERFPNSTFVVENVQSSPGMSPESAFTFGKHFGKVVGVLETFNGTVMYVPPKKWIEGLGLIGKGKDGIRAFAESVFKREFERQDHCDAALLGAYAHMITMVNYNETPQ